MRVWFGATGCSTVLLQIMFCVFCFFIFKKKKKLGGGGGSTAGS